MKTLLVATILTVVAIMTMVEVKAGNCRTTCERQGNQVVCNQYCY
jgi:hypothetical protein